MFAGWTCLLNHQRSSVDHYLIGPLCCFLSFFASFFVTLRKTTGLDILLISWQVSVKVDHSCPTLCDPMDYKVHGIL